MQATILAMQRPHDKQYGLQGALCSVTWYLEHSLPDSHHKFQAYADKHLPFREKSGKCYRWRAHCAISPRTRCRLENKAWSPRHMVSQGPACISICRCSTKRATPAAACRKGTTGHAPCSSQQPGLHASTGHEAATSRSLSGVIIQHTTPLASSCLKHEHASTFHSVVHRQLPAGASISTIVMACQLRLSCQKDQKTYFVSCLAPSQQNLCNIAET